MVFQGQGQGEVFSGFEKETREITAAILISYTKTWNYFNLAESSSKSDPTVLTKLGDDLLDANFATFLEGGVDKVKACEVLITHPLIRKDVATITSASKILDNIGIANIISKSELHTTVQKLAEKRVRYRTYTGGNPAYRYMHEILDDLEHGALKFGNEYTSIITRFKQGGHFTEGAMWVVEGVKNMQMNFHPMQFLNSQSGLQPMEYGGWM